MDEPVAVRMTFASTSGPVFIAATDRGVVAIERLTIEHDFDAAVTRRLGGRVVGAGTVTSRSNREKHLKNAMHWVDNFLSGRPPKAGDRPPIDLMDRNAWDRRVLEAVLAIP